MAGILGNHHVWAAVEESTYGTDAVGAAIDANDDLTYLPFLSGSQIKPSPNYYRPNQQRAGQDGIAFTTVENGCSWTLNAPMRGGIGSAFTPAVNFLLKACGFGEDTSGGTSSVYTIQTANDSSFSIWHWARNLTNNNLRLQRSLGCVGNLSVSGEIGIEATIAASGQGINSGEWTVDRAYFNASDEPALDEAGSSVTYTGAASLDAGERLICKSVTMTVGGTVYPCSAWNFDLAFAVGALGTQTGTYLPERIVRTRGDDANVSGNLALSMAAASAANYGAALDDVLTKYAASTEAALQIVLTGSSAQVTIDMPKIQLQRPEEREDNGAISWDVGFTANGDFGSSLFGENGVVITYDAA